MQLVVPKLNPVEPSWYVTRMPGGVGGVAQRGVPLSRSTRFQRTAAASPYANLSVEIVRRDAALKTLCIM